MFALMMVHGGVQTKAFLIIGTILAVFAKEYTSFTHLVDTLKLEMLKNAVKGAHHLASVAAN
jgi:ABC-type branched-subunit amino acid transport system permease subunit